MGWIWGVTSDTNKAFLRAVFHVGDNFFGGSFGAFLQYELHPSFASWLQNVSEACTMAPKQFRNVSKIINKQTKIIDQIQTSEGI